MAAGLEAIAENVALYRYAHEIDTVFVLAIRSRREAGYSERDSAG